MKDKKRVEEAKTMAKPPAEVRFPGDKNRRKKIRMRGIKQASKEIQDRLDRNLEELVEDPEVFLPEIKGEVDQSFFSKDLMARTLKEVSAVSAKRFDTKWLRKRMTKKGGDIVCRALAGSLLAASEEDRSTVAVFKNPLFGVASYIRRGNGRQGHLAGIQNHNHPKLRLLVWDEHAKSGQWFFSWDGGFVFTGTTPEPPSEWLDWSLDGASIDLSGEGDLRWSSGLEREIVENGELTESGWLRLEFTDGTLVGLSRSSLANTEEQFGQSVAMGMMPPRLSDIAQAEWVWRPAGWPEDRDLPAAGMERLEEVLSTWMGLALDDSSLARACRSSILNAIEDGYVVGTHWFPEGSREDFLGHMNGTDEERAAIACILDSLDHGIHVRTDGSVLNLDEDVVRLEESSCHPNLVALWADHGLTVLEGIYGIEDDEAVVVLEKQAKRKQGFGAFLRELGASRSVAMKLKRLPWESGVLPSPLSFADELIRQAVDRGIASTVSKARKGRGLDMAMGWAWLTVHDRTESDAWRFDEDSRDKGGDWVPALRALWDAASELLLNDNLDAAQDYESAMNWLAEVSGSGPINLSQ